MEKSEIETPNSPTKRMSVLGDEDLGSARSKS